MPRVISFFCLFRGYIFFLDLDALEAVLLAKSVTKATFQYQALGRLTGPGLLVSDGETWRQSRRALNPLFSQKAYARWERLFERIAESFLWTGE